MNTNPSICKFKEFTMERRKATRARRVISIQFRLVSSSKKNQDVSWHLSTTSDMSILGLSFLSDVSYALDHVLELHVVMSGVLDIYEGYGKIVRIERRAQDVFLIAVKFVPRPKSRGPSGIVRRKA